MVVSVSSTNGSNRFRVKYFETSILSSRFVYLEDSYVKSFPSFYLETIGFISFPR